jgi:hypothetical protein
MFLFLAVVVVNFEPLHRTSAWNASPDLCGSSTRVEQPIKGPKSLKASKLMAVALNFIPKEAQRSALQTMTIIRNPSKKYIRPLVTLLVGVKPPTGVHT